MADPSGDFWIVDRATGPEERESLEIDCPSAPCAFAVFASEESAWEYQKARLGPRWEISRISRLNLADLLTDLRVEFVVFDPLPDGAGRVATIFQVLVELC